LQIAAFIARAVADDVLPPAFVEEIPSGTKHSQCSWRFKVIAVHGQRHLAWQEPVPLRNVHLLDLAWHCQTCMPSLKDVVRKAWSWHADNTAQTALTGLYREHYILSPVGGGHRVKTLATTPTLDWVLLGSSQSTRGRSLNLASRTRLRMLAAFACSLFADAPCLLAG
jgi:hypothetical protein